MKAIPRESIITILHNRECGVPQSITGNKLQLLHQSNGLNGEELTPAIFISQSKVRIH